MSYTLLPLFNLQCKNKFFEVSYNPRSPKLCMCFTLRDVYTGSGNDNCLHLFHLKYDVGPRANDVNERNLQQNLLKKNFRKEISCDI